MNLYNELKKGIMISALGKYSNYIIQFGLLAVLSRILSPNEFGIVAIVNVFLLFFAFIVDMGIGPAIIQNKRLKDSQINSYFSFTLILTFILSCVFALLSNPVAMFYGIVNLKGVFLLMSLALFTSGMNIVPQAVLLKQKNFVRVNIGQIISGLLSGMAGIYFALNNFSYYALVNTIIIKNSIFFLVIYPKIHLKLTKRIRIIDLKEIYTFAKNQFLFNFINYFSRNMDNILIGKFMSPNALAYYDKAYTLSLYPNQILTSVITPVIQPILSEYELRLDVIKNTYLSITKILALFGLPLTVYLFFSSKEIIYILFGPQWDGSVITFQILSLSVWIQIISNGSGAFFQSANRTDLLLISGFFSAILNVSSIFVGVWSGKIEYVALVLVISFLINFIQSNYLLMIKIFNSKQIEFYTCLYTPLIISFPIVISMIIIENCMGSQNLIYLFLIKTIISPILFLVGLKITGSMGVIKQLLKRNNSK